MIHNDYQSSTSARRREETLLDSPATPLQRLEDPPPYGAQHRQNALWKGGNEALPPLWQEFKVLDSQTRYEDNNLYMGSWSRPLPGVRLDQQGDLIPGCEWHISPLGRSYFVNHNTQTTSWKKPTPEHPAGSLAPECIIEGHSKCIWSLACLDTDYNIMSTSEDGSICQWTRVGKPVGKPWDSDGEAVGSIAVSPDEKMVVSGSADGRLRLWNIKGRSVVGKPWEGHNAVVRCLDWSPNALEIVSGSEDGTVRRWNPSTGRQILPTIEAGHSWVYTVRYSPQGDKFASGGMDKVIRVWSKDGELLMELKGHERALTSLCWSGDGAHIFSASSDNTIRKWHSNNGEQLVVLEGHTSAVRYLCLSPDECHLVSASKDYSVRIWDLKTNQSVGDPLLHDDELWALAISPDGKSIVSAGLDAKIYVWSLEAALKQPGDQSVNNSNTERGVKTMEHAGGSRDLLDFSPTSKRYTQQASKKGPPARYGDDFWGNNTHETPRRSDPPVGPSSPPRRRSLFNFLRFSNRHATAPEPTVPQPRRWKFGLFPSRLSMHPFGTSAPTRNDDKSGDATLCKANVPPTMERTSVNKSFSSKQEKTAVEVQRLQVLGRPAQTGQGITFTAETEESSYVIGCCGFYFTRRSSSSY